MKIEKIIKAKFLKSGDYISTTGEEIIEIDIDFNQLLDIISEIELKRDGFGKNIHKEAFTGIDYLGNQVNFSSYVIWQDDDKIYKYRFDENWIPFNSEILRRDRDVKLNKIVR
jgi:hypothetical protein